MTKKLLASIARFKLMQDTQTPNLASAYAIHNELRRNLQLALNLDQSQPVEQRGRLNTKIIEKKQAIVDQMIDIETKIRLLR